MTYYELTSKYGHDTFLLDINNVGVAVKVSLCNELGSWFRKCEKSSMYSVLIKNIASLFPW